MDGRDNQQDACLFAKNVLSCHMLPEEDYIDAVNVLRAASCGLFAYIERARHLRRLHWPDDEGALASLGRSLNTTTSKFLEKLQHDQNETPWYLRSADNGLHNYNARVGRLIVEMLAADALYCGVSAFDLCIHTIFACMVSCVCQA